MQQGLLFEPQTWAQAELRQAIERLDFAAASLKLREFRRIWPASELAWEPELIRIGSRLARQRLDLDSGYSGRSWNPGWVPWESPGSIPVLCVATSFLAFWPSIAGYLRNCARQPAVRSKTSICWPNSLTTRGATTKSRSGKLETDGNSGCSSGIATFASDTHVWLVPIITGPSCWDSRSIHGTSSKTRNSCPGSAMPKIPNGPFQRYARSANYRRLDFQAVTSSRNLSPDL